MPENVSHGQEVHVRAKVERVEDYLDLTLTARAWPSRAGGSMTGRFSVAEARKLHRELGRKIESAARWEKRLHDAQKRNAKRRRR